MDHLRKLSAPGVVGFYSACEITEIVANVDGTDGPQNLFTIAVLEEREGAVAPEFLNPSRLTAPKLAGWSFGIYRYVVALGDFVQKVEAFAADGSWALSGQSLATAALVSMNPQFVPADQATPIPMNRVLKNNFWNGSHVLEWADPQKVLYQRFFDAPQNLADLSSEILQFVPIDIAALSDRLGNIVVQMPVTVLTSQFGKTRDGNSYQVQLGWHPKATPRPLQASLVAEFDSTVAGFVTAPVTAALTTLPLPDNAGQAKAMLWDTQHEVILGSTDALSFFEQIRFNMHIVGSTEPRTLSFADRAGTPKTLQIPLRGPKTESAVGTPRKDPNGGFTRRRLYRHETERTLRDKLFVQYGLNGSNPQLEHERALGDLRKLISLHGEDGAWLWDPYLDAIDILETLFHSPHSGADLRALSGAENRSGLNKQEVIAFEKAILNKVTSNFQGLKLEFRAAHSLPNIDFHDRFLIFPRRGQGDLAWSLGTSVNQAGCAHHILQQADDGQRVSDAFTVLWDRLGPAHLVWKRP